MIPLLHLFVIPALLALAHALERLALRLRQLAEQMPQTQLPTARLLVVGDRRFVMCDNRSEMWLVDDDAED